MTDQDPRPLKASGETPEELVRALRALGRDDRDAARLARVAERLGEAVASGAPAASGLRRLLGTKIGLTGLVVGLGALGALGYSLTADRTAPAAQLPAAPVSVPVASLAPPQETAPQPLAPALAREPDRKALRAARSVRRAPGSTSDRRVLAADELGGGPEPSVASTAEPAPQDVAEQTQEPTQDRTQPAPADPKPPAQPSALPAPRSEASLLREARMIAAREPAAALRLLDEHAKSFPNGMLVPERELLTIEMLRKLGRNAEAEGRVRQFEARYPGSLHMRRLERALSKDDN